MKQIIYRKDLLKLGFKDSGISAIVSGSRVFASISKQQGYAIQFTFDHASLIAIGCRLFGVGLPFRHVDFILSVLSAFDAKTTFMPPDAPVGYLQEDQKESIKELRKKHQYLLIKPARSVKGNGSIPAFDAATGQEIKVKHPKPRIMLEFAEKSESLLNRPRDARGEVVIVVPLGEIVSQVSLAFADE